MSKALSALVKLRTDIEDAKWHYNSHKELSMNDFSIFIEAVKKLPDDKKIAEKLS